MQEPMKNKIYYSMEARRDLDEIWDYIVTDLCNPKAAQCMIDRILDDVDRLTDFAEIGAPLSSIADTDADYRFLVTGNYMTFYRVSGENVYVDRILYGRRDYLRILIGDQLEEENLQ